MPSMIGLWKVSLTIFKGGLTCSTLASSTFLPFLWRQCSFLSRLLHSFFPWFRIPLLRPSSCGLLLYIDRVHSLPMLLLPRRNLLWLPISLLPGYLPPTYFKKRFCLFIFREREREGIREGGKIGLAASCMHPVQRPNLQPKPVPD